MLRPTLGHRRGYHTQYSDFLLAAISIPVGPYEWFEDKGDTILRDACNHTPSNHQRLETSASPPWESKISRSVLCGFSRPHNDRVQFTANMLTEHGGCFPARIHSLALCIFSQQRKGRESNQMSRSISALLSERTQLGCIRQHGKKG